MTFDALGEQGSGMAVTKSYNDDATDRRLLLLIGLVVVWAVGATGLDVWQAVRHPQPIPDAFLLLCVCATVVVANRVNVHVRIRGTRHGTSWGEVPVLVGMVIFPSHWVVLCAAVGVGLFKVINHAETHKTVFAVAKEILTASAAAAVLAYFDMPASLEDPVLDVTALVAAFAAMTIVDEAVFVPVISIASGMAAGKLLRQYWDIKLLGAIMRLVLVLLVVGVLVIGGSPSVLLAVPAIVFCVHLWHTHRLRTREERESWQRLAQTTDELNVVELDAVLTTAVTRATQLFTADEADVVLSSSRMVSGTADGLTYDGAPIEADERPGVTVLAADLEAHDGSHRIGTLRLRFHGQVTLTEFEHYKFRTFASAVSTAVRNAGAYAELERIAADNAYAALHDPLTGLANRRALLEQTEARLGVRTTEGMTALLLIDLNHFKEVNDTLGHTAGDEVLAEVAARLSAAAGPDDLVARLGGDEFAIVLTGLSAPAVAQHRANTLLTAFDRTIEADGMHLTVEASAGIALAPGSGGVDELLRRADVAMYQAKRAGQRTAVYVHSRDTADLGRLMLGGELSRAVARDEFTVDFQPIVDLGSGVASAIEALARWHHPDHGDLNPRRFLESVERSGHLPAFATAVLEHALAAAKAWRAAGFELPVSVNVSSRSLLDPAFPASVLDRLERHRIPADLLVLELTETLTVSQIEVVGRALGELRAAGVRLALDDFGAGACSLAALSRLPVHEVKIDQSFVRRLETSPEAAAVVRSTVDLARNLRLSAVAEGVESEPQRRALWELGCAHGQGHLFARPMAQERLVDALQRGSQGRSGAFAAPLHDAGAVVRMSRARRTGQQGKPSLPHLPA